MSLIIGFIVLLLVAFFSVCLGVLVAATIGIKRDDRPGDYRALRDGTDSRHFSGAGRRISGLSFPEQRRGSGPARPDGDETPSDRLSTVV